MQPPLAVEVSLDVFICVATADGRIEDPSRVRDLFIRAPRESANDIEIKSSKIGARKYAPFYSCSSPQGPANHS